MCVRIMYVSFFVMGLLFDYLMFFLLLFVYLIIIIITIIIIIIYNQKATKLFMIRFVFFRLCVRVLILICV
jgi:hypothetical protein